MTTVTQRTIGKARDDHLGEIEIKEVTLSSPKLKASILNYGGILNELIIKCNDGTYVSFCTGFNV